ncbi:MAG: phosphate signaling complex protein PhoU [Caldisericia bacterium]|jgi:phosphate transport system protein|nr:phosphate signaling complex protein PhoU [Caldisericia bacterium]
MSEILDKKILDLKEKLVNLSLLVRDQMEKSFIGLKERDKNLCKEVIDRDDLIDEKSIELEKEALQVIATQDPKAESLRVISAILFDNIDLERMADHCVDIAEITMTIADEPHLKPLIDLPRMKDICIKMLDNAIKGFLEKDTELCRITIEDDDILDDLNSQIFRELLTYMLEDPKNIKRANALLQISQHYERIGDHITNLCERAIYAFEGKLIKTNPHKPRY